MEKNPDASYKILKIIEENPEYTQRKIAHELGYSLGKVNYVLTSLIDKGLVKVHRFIKSKNKWGYRYVLSTKGIKERYRITKEFLKRKLKEYDEIQHEIEEAQARIEKDSKLLDGS